MNVYGVTFLSLELDVAVGAWLKIKTRVAALFDSILLRMAVLLLDRVEQIDVLEDLVHCFHLILCLLLSVLKLSLEALNELILSNHRLVGPGPDIVISGLARYCLVNQGGQGLLSVALLGLLMDPKQLHDGNILDA